MNLRSRIVLAAAGVVAQAANAAGNAVDTLGTPDYVTRYQLVTMGGFGDSAFLTNLEAVNGTVGVDTISGALWNSAPALQQALVTNDGVTYWARASGPTLSSTPVADTVVGAISSVEVYQSFTKTSDAAQLSFTYTGGLLQSFRDPEFQPPCVGCTFAEVKWAVQVWASSAPQTLLMEETGRAALGIQNNVFKLFSSQTALDGTPVNPLWGWTCNRCDQNAVGVADAVLQSPFTGIVDLSAIPFDPQAAQQTEFTVRFSLASTATVNTLRVGSTAWARDPLDLGNNAGVGLLVSNLQPTNNPVGVVPEPGTALLLAAGLWSLLLRRRLFNNL